MTMRKTIESKENILGLEKTGGSNKKVCYTCNYTMLVTLYII